MSEKHGTPKKMNNLGVNAEVSEVKMMKDLAEVGHKETCQSSPRAEARGMRISCIKKENRRALVRALLRLLLDSPLTRA